MELKRRNWSERNHRELKQLLAGVRPGEVAVFDWDNTCAFNDVGEALLRRLAFGLEFRMDRAAWEASLPDRIGCTGAVLLNGRPKPLPRVKGEILSAWERLRQRQGRLDNDYRTFTSGLLALNRALEQTPGIGCDFAYPWVNFLLQGFSPAELDAFSRQVVDREARAPLRRRAVLDPGRRWRYDWLDGVRLFAEMRDLAACWRERGGRVVVSSASNRRLVQAAAERLGFPCQEIIGMDLEVRGGRFAAELKQGLLPNLGAGKTANLRRLGIEPALVAGDSGNDFEMLTAFAATRLRLVVGRGGRGALRPLVRRARAGEPGFLVQEVDRRRGAFRPDGG